MVFAAVHAGDWSHSCLSLASFSPAYSLVPAGARIPYKTPIGMVSGVHRGACSATKVVALKEAPSLVSPLGLPHS